MTLDELEAASQPRHITGGSTLSIVARGHRYVYLTDPVTGTIERRHMGCCEDKSVYRHDVAPAKMHGLGAVRD